MSGFRVERSVSIQAPPEKVFASIVDFRRWPQPFLMKLMSLFMSMDRMVGKDFEAGLANLKRLSEQ